MMNSIQRILTQVGALMLAVGRTIYCWLFFLWSVGSIYMVSINIRRVVRTHVADKGAIVSSILFTIYSVVFGIAWWMILRRKPALKRWAIMADLVLIFFYVPLAFFGGQGVVKDELDWWPIILIGIFGIIIFSISHHGFRHRSQMFQESPKPS
jgi:hypothetical protein